MHVSHAQALAWAMTFLRRCCTSALAGKPGMPSFLQLVTLMLDQVSLLIACFMQFQGTLLVFCLLPVACLPHIKVVNVLPIQGREGWGVTDGLCNIVQDLGV